MQFKPGDIVWNHYGKHRHCDPSAWDGLGIVTSINVHNNETIVIVHKLLSGGYESGGFEPAVLELLGHVEES